VVALPTFRWVARAFPSARRYVLTNFSISAKAPPLAEVLDGTGLVDGYVEYPVGIRNPSRLWALAEDVRRLKPDVLVYLVPPRGLFKAWRDYLFFRACGVASLIGVPLTPSSQTPLLVANGVYEYEGARLLRSIAGRAEPLNVEGLSLTNCEKESAERILHPLGRLRSLLAISIGSKDNVKDWGDENWTRLLRILRPALPGWGLVLLGAAAEHWRSANIAMHWGEDCLNLCGLISVREAAAVLEHAKVYCGHDSGPMHLAAAQGVPCVAVFSSRNLPGEWFPLGATHKVIYHTIECQGCRLISCEERRKACIRSISVDEVFKATMDLVSNSMSRTGMSISH